MEKLIARLVVYALLALAVFVFVRRTESRMMFFPSGVVEGTPADAGMAGYKWVQLRASDGPALSAWFIDKPGARFTLLFLHGNAGNISHRLEKLRILHDLGLAVLIVDYRGYGKSEGKPTEPGLYRDAEAAYRYLTEERKIPAENVVVYGESLGCAVASELASRFLVRALILESGFTSARDMAAHAFPFAPRFLMGSRLDTRAAVSRVKAQTLVIHSVNDEIVPYRMGEALFEAAAGPKRLLKITGGHNTGFVDSRKIYSEGLRDFLAALTNPPGS